MKKALKIIRNIFVILIVLIMIAAGIVAVIAKKNMRSLNECVDDTLKQISNGHHVKELQAGNYENLTIYKIMKFDVKHYDIESVGHLSIMKVNVGLMQMATIVITPVEKNLPVLSCDYMYILNNRKSYVELYDLVKEKDEEYMKWMAEYAAVKKSYEDLKDDSGKNIPGEEPNPEIKSYWYDSLMTVAAYKNSKPDEDHRMKGLLIDTVKTFLAQSDSLAELSAEAKTDKLKRIKEYSDRLIAEGGISTSLFKQTLGEDITRDFFDKVFFGTELYQD